MKPVFFLLIVILFLQSCGTVINTSTINIEIVVPPKVKFPSIYKNVAVRYNNSNVAYNPNLSIYAEGEEIKTNPFNTDSIASKIYFNSFIDHMNNQVLFDSIQVLAPGDYSKISIDNTLKFPEVDAGSDSSVTTKLDYPTKPVFYLSNLLRLVKNDSTVSEKTVALDQKLGLYNKSDLKQIRDTTQADLLFSLDFFNSYNEVLYDGYTGVEVVFITPFWNVYDLKRQKIIYFHIKEDTLFWENKNVYNLNSAVRRLPPMKDATLIAAPVSANEFVKRIAPHWLEVERLYYQSVNMEMKNAEKLLKQNKWLEAAEIWNRNSKNENKVIAAKSMFNLGLACEINGQLDAAIDWITKSNAVVKNNNPLHKEICANYLKVLHQRKLDIKAIENQLIDYDN